MDLIKGYKINFSRLHVLVHYYSFNAFYKAKKKWEEKINIIIFKKERQSKQTRKSKNPKWGSLWSPNNQKKKHFPLEDLQKKTKKNCKLKVPLKEYYIYHWLFTIYGKRVYYFNTSTFTFSQNNLHLLCTSLPKPKKENPHIPSFSFNQIAKTLETSKPKLNFA